MDSYVAVAHALSMAFLAAGFDEPSLIALGVQILGREPKWLRPLIRRIVGRYGDSMRPRRRELIDFIIADPGFHRASRARAMRVSSRPILSAAMSPMPAARAWAIPQICTVGALGEWLDVPVRQLEWFADLHSLETRYTSERLRNYRYRVLQKGNGQVRLIEAPKPRLKEIQRRLLTGILDAIPPHDAAHGFRRGRSIRSFAAPHVGQTVVLKIDLEDFFPSVPAARVDALFRAIGYPESVANLLAGLSTNAAPVEIWSDLDCDRRNRREGSTRRKYEQPHLPQGAPTSPALANLCAFRLDCRLDGLARAAGATYTRYADDLAFSGGATFARVVHRFQHHVSATILEEGFQPHFRKTRIMRRGVRQCLAGIVVNERLNLQRRDYDRLKATLTNCVRHGPASQNRAGVEDFRAHLTGSVAYVESIHAERGKRLRQMLEQIEWACL